MRPILLVMATTETTRNESNGFYGTMDQAGVDARLAWTKAISTVMAAAAVDAADARRFLDSGAGRHFADAVLGAAGSLDDQLAAAVAFFDTERRWRAGTRTGRFPALVRRWANYEDEN